MSHTGCGIETGDYNNNNS